MTASCAFLQYQKKQLLRTQFRRLMKIHHLSLSIVGSTHKNKRQYTFSLNEKIRHEPNTLVYLFRRKSYKTMTATCAFLQHQKKAIISSEIQLFQENKLSLNGKDNKYKFIICFKKSFLMTIHHKHLLPKVSQYVLFGSKSFG